jgi:cytochrome oxidase Cu insertion factor (SCO1/SenC/PrrC family)
MNDSSPQPSGAARRGRTQLIAIALIAAATLAGSVLLFQSARDGGVWGTTNRGTFVQPPITLTDLAVRDEAGMALTEGITWWLWVVPGGTCDTECEQALHQLRQLHILLNRDADRVQRALVTGDGVKDQRLAEAYPRMKFLAADQAALSRGIYIVDPIGNLVLYYPLSDAGKPVLDDLKRLLKVSQIG